MARKLVFGSSQSTKRQGQGETWGIYRLSMGKEASLLGLLLLCSSGL